MNELSSAMISLATQLATLAVKGTATAVTVKIRATKEVKDAEKLRTIYDEMVNELLNERDEAIRIAQAYKSEIDRIVISDEDIKHLQATISNILDLLKNIAPDTPIDSIEQFKSLISVDTLKVMQLLGFNYKAAIGEPLTNICAGAINSLGQKHQPPSGKNAKRK